MSHRINTLCCAFVLTAGVSLGGIARAETAGYREREPMRQGAWSRVVNGGFGDANLELIARLTEFKGRLYAALDHKSGGGCQIWRSPNGKEWQVVVGPGAATPAGFGAPPNPSINELLVFGGRLYAGTWNQDRGAELWRSADGVTWEPVVGGGAATPNGFGKHENSGITALGAFKGTLFAGTGSLYCKDGVELWRSADGLAWDAVAGERIAMQTEMARESKYFLDLAEFNGAFYISTGDQRTGGSEIWSTQDGQTWKPVVGPPSPYRAGMGNPGDDMIYDLEPFKGRLYAGVLNYQHDGGALWRSADGLAWEVISGDAPAPISPGFGENGNIGLISLAVFDGALYVGTTNETGTQVWRSPDGTQWQPVVGQSSPVPAGFGNIHNRAINTLTVFHHALYAGTHNPAEGAELWRYQSAAAPAADQH